MKTVEELIIVKSLRLHIQEFLDRAEAKYTSDEEHNLFSFNMENNGMGINVYIIYNEEGALPYVITGESTSGEEGSCIMENQ